MEIITRLKDLFPSVDATYYAKPSEFTPATGISFKQAGDEKDCLHYFEGDTVDLIVHQLDNLEPNLASIEHSCRVVAEVCYVSHVKVYLCVCPKCMENATLGLAALVTSPTLPVYTVDYLANDPRVV